MKTHENTEYSVEKVGKGLRKFNGEFYFFRVKASMKGSFADNGYERHVQEVKDYAEDLRKKGYKVRVIPTKTGEYLIYTKGERRF